MNLIPHFATHSDCYRANRTIAVKGLMLHSVGCPQPSAEVFARLWDKPGATACVHAVLQPDGTIYQCLPWNHRGWHAGSPPKGGVSANNTHIGVEMTEPDTLRYTQGASFTDRDPAQTEAHIRATYSVAVALFSQLCKDFSLDPMGPGVIVSHREGHRLGIASGHADPEHLWSKSGLTMDGFRADVKAMMER